MLTGFLCLAHLAYLLIILKTTHPRVATNHSGLGPPISIINKENIHRLVYGQSDASIFSIEYSPSQMTQDFLRLVEMFHVVLCSCDWGLIPGVCSC